MNFCIHKEGLLSECILYQEVYHISMYIYNILIVDSILSSICMSLTGHMSWDPGGIQDGRLAHAPRATHRHEPPTAEMLQDGPNIYGAAQEVLREVGPRSEKAKSL